MTGVTWGLGIGLGLLYLLSIGVLVKQRELGALKDGLLGSSFAGVLIALSLFLTRGWELEALTLKMPWVGLVVFVVLGFLSIWIVSKGYFPKLIVRNQEVGNIIVKLLFTCFIPLGLMFAKGDPLRWMGLDFSHWERELGIGLLIGALWFLFSLLTGEGKHSHKIPLSLSRATSAFARGFGFHIFQTAIPEEFFFRVFLLGHLATLTSDGIAIIISSLVFGLGHIIFYLSGPEQYRLSSGKISFLSALARATLGEVSAGLLFGVLWVTTGSLIPIVLLHAVINTTSLLRRLCVEARLRR